MRAATPTLRPYARALGVTAGHDATLSFVDSTIARLEAD
jgi:hypothetical protein